MTQVTVQGGLLFPVGTLSFVTSGTNTTMDAATEKVAMIGRVAIAGRATNKVLSTGTIQWRSGAVTFANGSTTVDIGLQDVATGAGPIAQPDGTFDVLTTLTGGGGGITANAWQTTTMNSGTKTLSHGDLVAVVWDMTARGGADTVQVTVGSSLSVGLGGTQLPTTNIFVSSAWQTTLTGGAGRAPNVVIVFDDSTIGWIDFTHSASVYTAETFADGTNPDERGMIFQVPWDCKIDGFWAMGGLTNATSDFTFKLYSSPTSSPSLITSVAVAAENLGVSGIQSLITATLTSETTLSRNTDYIATMLATGAGNVRLQSNTLGSTDHRVQYMNGSTLAKGTRDGSSGNFTAESPAVTIPFVGVRISSFDDGDGTGGGGVTPLGNGLHPIGTGVGA